MNSRVLNARHFVVAIAVSPAMIFLLFLGVFHALYVNWAKQHAVPIAEMHLQTRSGYTVKIDSVAVSLSSLMFFRVRVLEEREMIGEVDTLVLYEPSLLSLLFAGKLTARRVEVGAIRTTRNDVRTLFEAQATFFPDPP